MIVWRPPNYGREKVIQPGHEEFEDAPSYRHNRPWGVLGPIPPIISILLAAATATAGSYLATRERLVIAEQRIEALQHQVADLKSDIADVRSLLVNRMFTFPPMTPKVSSPFDGKVTVTPQLDRMN